MGQDALLNLAAFTLQVGIIAAAAAVLLERAAYRLGRRPVCLLARRPGGVRGDAAAPAAACGTCGRRSHRQWLSLGVVTVPESGFTGESASPTAPATTPQPLPWSWIVAILVVAGATAASGMADCRACAPAHPPPTGSASRGRRIRRPSRDAGHSRRPDERRTGSRNRRPSVCGVPSCSYRRRWPRPPPDFVGRS